MAIKVNGLSQEPNKNKAKKNTMFDYQNVHTGSSSTHPGVKKAKEDKKKADANLKTYKEKIQKQKTEAIKKAQVKK